MNKIKTWCNKHGWGKDETQYAVSMSSILLILFGLYFYSIYLENKLKEEKADQFRKEIKNIVIKHCKYKGKYE